MGPVVGFLLMLYIMFVVLLIARVFAQGGQTGATGDTAGRITEPNGTDTAPDDAGTVPPTLDQLDTGVPPPNTAAETDTALAAALEATAPPQGDWGDVPYDNPLALQREGWRAAASDESDLYVGEFEADGTSCPGAVERRPSGRVKVYVKDPPRRMRSNAHNGRCLREPSRAELDSGDGWREVHFSRDPETVTDSIGYVQTLME